MSEDKMEKITRNSEGRVIWNCSILYKMFYGRYKIIKILKCQQPCLSNEQYHANGRNGKSQY